MNHGIRSELVSQGRVTQSEVTKEVVRGEYQIVLMSPEVMLTELKCREMFRSKVYRDNIVGLVINEA